MNFKTQSTDVVKQDSSGVQVFLNKVYSYMASSLCLSGLVAYLTSKEPFVNLLYKTTERGISHTVLGWIVVFAPLAFLWFISSASIKGNIKQAKTMFWVFSVLMGASLSSVFLYAPGATIFKAFLITAGAFMALSLYGRSTERDLSGWGSFLFMGVIGIILASIVNIFLASSFLSFAVSVVGVIIFAALTAYDTQRLKVMYAVNMSQEEEDCVAVNGALSLYINFINMFQFILSFLMNRE